jgi:hypothetical protein
MRDASMFASYTHSLLCADGNAHFALGITSELKGAALLRRPLERVGWPYSTCRLGAVTDLPSSLEVADGAPPQWREVLQL